MSNEQMNIEEHLYKILVIGEFGVGKLNETSPVGLSLIMEYGLINHHDGEWKGPTSMFNRGTHIWTRYQITSIIKRYTEGTFSPNYKLTIGVDFALKSINWNDATKINLQLWDIAGHERFGHMTRVYYKYAIAAIIVYDLSRPATFESVLKWYTDVNQKVMLANEQPVPILLIANKSDLHTSPLDEATLDAFCKKHEFVGWFSTSAKDDKNIDKAMHFLVETILSLTSDGQKPEEHISLQQPDTNYLQTIDEEEFKENSCCGKN